MAFLRITNFRLEPLPSADRFTVRTRIRVVLEGAECQSGDGFEVTLAYSGEVDFAGDLDLPPDVSADESPSHMYLFTQDGIRFYRDHTQRNPIQMINTDTELIGMNVKLGMFPFSESDTRPTDGGRRLFHGEIISPVFTNSEWRFGNQEKVKELAFVMTLGKRTVVGFDPIATQYFVWDTRLF